MCARDRVSERDRWRHREEYRLGMSSHFERPSNSQIWISTYKVDSAFLISKIYLNFESFCFFFFFFAKRKYCVQKCQIWDNMLAPEIHSFWAPPKKCFFPPKNFIYFTFVSRYTWWLSASTVSKSSAKR